MLIFPEGTRSEDGQLRELVRTRMNAALAAVRANVGTTERAFSTIDPIGG